MGYRSHSLTNIYELRFETLWLHLPQLYSNWMKLQHIQCRTSRHYLSPRNMETFLRKKSTPCNNISAHKNLTCWQHMQKLNCQQARWSLYLSRFNVQLIHVPKSRMVQSDTLSRWPDHISENDDDNENIVILPDNLFINLIDVKLTKIIESETTSDELVKNILNVISMKGIPPIKSSHQSNLVFPIGK